MIGFCRRFHKVGRPFPGLFFTFLCRQFPGFCFIALIADKHERNIVQRALIISQERERYKSSKWINKKHVVSSYVCSQQQQGLLGYTLISRMISQVGLSSSRDCREVTEKTMMKACPLEMLSRCMAGNWWLPVVSVICSVQIEFLLHVITCQIIKKKLESILLKM